MGGRLNIKINLCLHFMVLSIVNQTFGLVLAHPNELVKQVLYFQVEVIFKVQSDIPFLWELKLSLYHYLVTIVIDRGLAIVRCG